MITTKNMEAVVTENFERYAGNVILDRAICDVRDMLKPSARMLLYSQEHITKNTYKKPFVKSARIVGDCLGHLYEHGDSSCYGAYIRMAQPFAMRYPLEECQGSYGTMTKNGDEASMRYTELRISELGSYVYGGLDKNAIGNDWRFNFDKTEQYPAVMPSIGYFNICNGTIGLGIAISSSIPQFNLRDVNAALIELIKNPQYQVDIMPDFATGATLINAAEVREALQIGGGKACKLRATISYNADINSLVVTEVPYGVYTGKIKEIIANIINEENGYGIKSINDNSGDSAEIYIELEKGANPKRIIEKLYKDTPLESHFTINMWVLENGRFPKQMGLTEIFSNYITHIRLCKTREVQFDLDKALARKNIVDGLIKAYSIIDEVIATIKASESPSIATTNLITKFAFNEEQAKAILAMKLSSLTKLDIVKLENEREELISNIKWYQHLLNDSTALDAELIKILQEVADKFGDERRTKILDIEEPEEPESIKEEEISVMLFDNNMIRLTHKDDLQGGKRGRKGTNIKPPKGANLIKTLYTTNLSAIAAFTNQGRMYNLSVSDLDYDKDYSVYELISLQDIEKVLLIIDATSFNSYHNLITVSKNGYIKKSVVSEYNTRNKKGIAAVKLDSNDLLVGVYLSSNDNDKIFIASSSGNYNFYALEQINATGRATRGAKAIKLQDNEIVCSATIIKESIGYKGILTITQSGKGKITPVTDFTITSRAIKGSQVMNLKDDKLAVVYAVPENQEKIFISADNKAVLIEASNIPVQNRSTTGVLIIDARDKNTTIEIM